jgi:hypothetical protein
VTGDVEVTGVPMRNQGEKGYCVAASCERLFRYLGQPCDMDELAIVCGTDAEQGTSPSVMYSSLTKIDQRYNMRLKLLFIPQGFGLGPAMKNETELERAQKASLPKLVQEHIDAGLPLLWGVILPPGQSGTSSDTEDDKRPMTPPFRITPPFPVRPDPVPDGVGHMRLIIGYNSKTNALIYTDSWGASHERKVMRMGEATDMTTAIFSMSPNR